VTRQERHQPSSGWAANMRPAMPGSSAAISSGTSHSSHGSATAQLERGARVAAGAVCARAAQAPPRGTDDSYDGHGNALMPCGRCRQLLFEHSAEGMLLETVSGIKTIDEVIPDAFGPRTLSEYREEGA